MNGQTFSQNPRMPGKSHSYQVLILRDPFRDLLLCTLLCMLICCKMQTYIHIATNTSHRVWDIMTQVTRAANAWWTVTEGNNPPPHHSQHKVSHSQFCTTSCSYLEDERFGIVVSLSVAHHEVKIFLQLIQTLILVLLDFHRYCLQVNWRTNDFVVLRILLKNQENKQNSSKIASHSNWQLFSAILRLSHILLHHIFFRCLWCSTVNLAKNLCFSMNDVAN